MTLQKNKKEELIKSFAQDHNDTGSTAVQIALLTENIKLLTEHLKKNAHDFSSKRGLLKMVSRRRNFLQYLERTDYKQYQTVIEKLELKELKK